MKQKNDYELWNSEGKKKNDENLTQGIIGAAVGAGLGATLWAVLTLLFGGQTFWMPIGVGLLAGVGMRIMGKGTEPPFGIAGAGMAFAGCLVGSVMSFYMLAALELHIPVYSVLWEVTPTYILGSMARHLGFLDLILYGIATGAGYLFSVTPMT
jgi:hypothetical protein